MKESLMVIASVRNGSGDESLRKLILPVILIFLLCLGMVSALVYATDNEDGQKHHGGNENEIDSSNGNIDNRDNKSGIDSSNSNSGDGGNWKGNGNDNGKGIGARGNERNAVVNAGYDQKSDVGIKTAVVQTAVVQRTVSMHVQVSVVVLLVASVEATPSVNAAWWSLVESNAERIFRKFFFLSGSIGEKIRRKNVLKNRKRREIYLFIVNNPFSHFRRITRMVEVGPNEGSWHLRILEKMGLIKSEYVGRYLTYHANNSDHLCNRDTQLINLIPNMKATKILEYLHSNPGVKIAHLTQALMINRNTISYHIRRMQTSGLVERVGRNGLRLSPIGEDREEGLVHVIPRLASRIQVVLNIDST